MAAGYEGAILPKNTLSKWAPMVSPLRRSQWPI